MEVQPIKINIATPSYGSTYSAEYVRSFYRLMSTAYQRNVVFTFTDVDYADIVVSRNYLISNFYYLQKDCSHILFLDDDMGFSETLIYDMIATNNPVVGVVYPKRAIDLKRLHSMSNLPFDEAFANSCEFIGKPIKTNTNLQFNEVDQCGTGIFLISRKCIDEMIARCPEIVDRKRFKRMPFGKKFKEFITPFEKVYFEDRELSEDFSFCYRWTKKCKGKIIASIDSEVAHVGQLIVKTKYAQREKTPAQVSAEQALLNIPASWDKGAHQLWMSGDRVGAIKAAVKLINTNTSQIPYSVGMQLSYYFSMHGDYRSAAKALRELCRLYPDEAESRLNFGIALNRSGEYAECVTVLNGFVNENPGAAAAWDALSSAYYRLGEEDLARSAGEKSLTTKDSGVPNVSENKIDIASTDYLNRMKIGKNVISFSLWGANPRYLRGAIQNVVRARDLYPDWVCRFYIDNSIPDEFVSCLEDLGAELIKEDSARNASLNRYRLSRRFWVANDPSVARFLVRDCDSVVNERELVAVDEWVKSGRRFHVMRDWWTHTDLVLAGMWGGVAGQLPDLKELFDNYKGSLVETPHWDQWFLRDCVWAYIRQDCLVHDRIFRTKGSTPFPGVTPRGHRHVGQDEFAVRRREQELEIAPWIERLTCLQLSAAKLMAR